tara:strand:+ start:995 stop:1717 length:723 start_codon:yes stop_codon:yes gene_type:complete
MKIEFTAFPQRYGHLPPPVPTSRVIPDWWRDMPRTNVWNRDGVKPAHTTIKACVPFLDTLRTGYVIPMWADLAIGLNNENGEALLQWRNSIWDIAEQRQWEGFVNRDTGIGLPGTEVVPNPNAFILDNPWQIKTPEGYSCLFTPVLNANLPLHFSSGIVNTDTYHSLINFPFFIKDRYVGILKKGTPLIQVIPFKRDEWEHEVRAMTDGDTRDLEAAHGDIQSVFESGYLENHGCPVRHT